MGDNIFVQGGVGFQIIKYIMGQADPENINTNCVKTVTIFVSSGSIILTGAHNPAAH